MALSRHTRLRSRLAQGVAFLALAAGLAVAPAQVSMAAAGDGLTAYISPPFVQGPPSSFNATIEDFNSAGSCTLPRTNPSVGTFSGSCTSVNSGIGDHIFGGANTTSAQPTVGGTASTFVAAWGAQALTVEFTAPVKYVGFWWSAGSAGNQVKFYAADRSTLLATFTTDNINSLLNTSGANEPSVLPPPVNQYPGTQVVTALDGSQYLKGYYFGRPADHTTLTPTVLPRGVSGNAYNANLNIYSHAYMNLYATGSIDIGKVEFIGGGFEFDNLAVSNSQQTPPSDQVLLQSVLGKSVDYRANGGTGSMTPQTSTSTATLSANTFSRLGHTFSGWHTTASGTGGTSLADQASYNFASDLTLYAQWTANTLNITYDSQLGTAPSGGATTTTTGATVSALPTTSRAGHTFDGWFTASSGGVRVTTTSAHGQTADFTLYAQWTADTLTVMYDSQSGSAISSGSTTTGGQIAASPGTPTLAGYTFSGWFVSSSGGSPIAFPYTHNQTANFTLYAQWTANSAPPVVFVPPTPPLPRPERVGDTQAENSSLAVSQTYFTPGVEVVYLATEDTYADALVAGPRAGTDGGPIILTDPVRMTKPVADELIRLRPDTIVVVGQTDAVGPDVEAAARFLAPNVIRVGGVDRYETAVQMSRRLTQSTNQTAKVYVASGEDFADAVTSGPIASLDGAPILLTRRNAIPAVTRAELVALDPTEIVIIGGPSAVSTAVETELRALADTVTRIGGDSRYTTAASLAADRVVTAIDTVFLAVGDQFHHAVIAAPVATAKRTAVLLVQQNCVPLATRNQLDRLRPNKIIVVGADSTNTQRILDLTPC